jgi:hypothetical protein
MISLAGFVKALRDHHRRLKKKRGTLRVEEGWLTFDGARLVEAKDLLHAVPMPTSDAAQGMLAHVVLTPRGMWRGPFDIAVASMDLARALVLALDKSTNQSVARFPAVVERGPLDRLLTASVGFGAVVSLASLVWLAGMHSFTIWWFFSLPLAVIASLFRRTVVVGGEGIYLPPRTRIGKKAFVPYASLASVRREQQAVVLQTNGGKPLRLVPRDPHGDRVANDLLSAALAERIEEARAEWAARGEAQLSPLLARGGRSVADWLIALRSLGESAAGFRAAALPADTLLRIAEDPRAGAGERAGAAASLVGHLDDAGAARVRVAAEVCASPELRRVLTVTAEQKAAEIEEALAQVGEGEEPLAHADRKRAALS